MICDKNVPGNVFMFTKAIRFHDFAIRIIMSNFAVDFKICP